MLRSEVQAALSEIASSLESADPKVVADALKDVAFSIQERGISDFQAVTIDGTEITMVYDKPQLTMRVGRSGSPGISFLIEWEVAGDIIAALQEWRDSLPSA